MIFSRIAGKGKPSLISCLRGLLGDKVKVLSLMSLVYLGSKGVIVVSFHNSTCLANIVCPGIRTGWTGLAHLLTNGMKALWCINRYKITSNMSDLVWGEPELTHVCI